MKINKNQWCIMSSKIRTTYISVARKGCIKNTQNLAVLCTAASRPVGLLAEGYCEC